MEFAEEYYSQYFAMGLMTLARGYFLSMHALCRVCIHVSHSLRMKKIFLIRRPGKLETYV